MYFYFIQHLATNTSHQTSDGFMLCQRHRRRTSIKPALVQRIVFGSHKCWYKICDNILKLEYICDTINAVAYMSQIQVGNG